MKNEKQSERVARALVAMGCVEEKSTSRKYRVFICATSSPQKYYFVGKAGALRVGSCASKSTSLTDTVLPSLLAKYAPLNFETQTVRS